MCVNDDRLKKVRYSQVFRPQVWNFKLEFGINLSVLKETTVIRI